MATKRLQTGLHHTQARAGWRALAGAAALAAVLGGSALPAHAAAVTYNFAGNGDWLSDAHTSSFSGSFTYESTATDSIGNGSTASYAHAGGGAWGLTLSIDGAAAFTLNSSFNVNISNNLGSEDRIGVLASDGASQWADLDLVALSTLLTDVSLDALNGGLNETAFFWPAFMFEDGMDTLQGLLTSLSCASGCSASGGDPNPGGGDPNPGGGGGGGGNGGGGSGGGGSGGGGNGGGGGIGDNTVPEPASASLVLLALGAAGMQQRRRNGRSAKA